MSKNVLGSIYTEKPIDGKTRTATSFGSSSPLTQTKRDTKLSACPFCGDPIPKGLSSHLTKSAKCRKAFKEAAG